MLEKNSKSFGTHLQGSGLVLSDFISNNCYFNFRKCKSHTNLYLVIALPSIILKMNMVSFISSGGTTLPSDKQCCLQHQSSKSPVFLNTSKKTEKKFKSSDLKSVCLLLLSVYT